LLNNIIDTRIILSPQFNSFARSSYSAKRKPLYRCFFCYSSLPVAYVRSFVCPLPNLWTRHFENE